MVALQCQCVHYLIATRNLVVEWTFKLKFEDSFVRQCFGFGRSHFE